jgi:AcrR family transcriptional regulator
VAAESPAGRRPGRPRSLAREQAILTSAGRLLLAEGMAAFTIERVAADAGVSRVTIYKWWPSKGALALDGFLHVVQDEIAYPDTGDLRADLIAQVTSLVRLFRDTAAARVLTGLLAEAQRDPAVAREFRGRWLQPRRSLAAAIVQRGQQQGIIRHDVDVAAVIDQIYGPVYYRLFAGHEPLVDELATTVVDNVLAGIRAL